MASREKLDKAYLRMAAELAKLSTATRKKVGCLIVKDTHIIAEGYNGTPRGFSNICEEGNYLPHDLEKDHKEGGICRKCLRPIYNGSLYACSKETLVTKPEVIHAEMNALAKVCKSTQSSEGAFMYLTLSPCFDCAKLIIQAGITKVMYSEEYRDLSGIELLRKANVICLHIPPDLLE